MDQSNCIHESRPCTFHPSCPDQCPNLQVDAANSSRCICGHLISLHVATTEECPPPPTTPSFSATRPLQGSSLGSQLHGRLFSKLSALRSGVGLGSLPTAGALPAARAEVNAGFLGQSRSTSHSTSRSASCSTSRSTPRSGSRSTSRSVSRSVAQRKASVTATTTPDPLVGSSHSTKGKGKGKSKSNQPVDIHGIYFVPDAYRSITKRVNNAGVELVTVDCHAPTPCERDRLVEDGFGRVTEGLDVIQLDPQFDSEQTAQLLATLFPTIYARAQEHFGISEHDLVPSDWFMQLIKTRTRLSNQPNGQGATARQLISGASTVGGTAFLIDDGDVGMTSGDDGDESDNSPANTPSPPDVGTLIGKGKGKRKRSDEPEESEESETSIANSNKRVKIEETSADNSTISLPNPTSAPSSRRL
ncbi:hypothetical protein FRC07_013670 [Ceratobasidium sp. 392]|nr:hypothetical protein FRC07_013670 [Ceratobasidium sp. 392]